MELGLSEQENGFSPNVPTGNLEQAVEITSPENKKETFMVEEGGQQFEFTFIPSSTPTELTLLHLPGLRAGGGGGNNLIPIQRELDGVTNGLALSYYMEPYSKDNLRGAIQKALEIKAKGPVIMHGHSYGASLVYDLVSDDRGADFIKTNNIAGVILESPVIDKDNMSPRIRNFPDRIILAMSGALSNFAPPPEGIASSKELDRQMMAEVLRLKTKGGKIDISVLVSFAEADKLIDRETSLKTLQELSSSISAQIYPSAQGEHGHQFKDIGDVRSKEREFIEQIATQFSRQKVSPSEIL